jgi:hypothetical protein
MKNSPSKLVLAGSLLLLASGLVTQSSAYAANCSAMPVSGKVYNTVNEGSGLVLDVAGNPSKEGGNVLQWPVKGTANQQWKLDNLGSGNWSIRPVHSGMSLGVYGWPNADGSPIKQWKLNSASNGAYKTASVYSKLNIAVGNGNKGATINQSSDNSSAYQRWYFNPVDGNCGASASGKT